MNLLHKTNSVLNFLKPIDLVEYTDRYNNQNICDNRNINYTSRKETSNLSSFNLINETGNSEKSKNNRNKNELSESKIKKTYQIEYNTPNISFKKKIINKISENNKNQSQNQTIKAKEKKIGYMNEKYIKMIEENKKLKEKLNSKGSDVKEQLIIFRDENIKLKSGLEKLNKINDEFNNQIKEKEEIIEKQKNLINDMNIKISELTRDNINLLNNINNLKIIIQKLSRDKNILINEISELNKSLTNKIKPKLIKNENYLLSLEQQLNILKKENDSLIENDIKQKNLIKTFKSKQNSRKMNLINNISQSKSTEDLNINNSTYNTSKKKIIKGKQTSRKKPNSNNKNRLSEKIKKLKNKFKKNNINIKTKGTKGMKKSLSQKNINNIKSNNDVRCNDNNKEDITYNNISSTLNQRKINHIYNTAIIRKNNNKENSIKKAIIYKPKFSNKNILKNEENKQNELITMNKKKENSVSLLSSFNEDIKY